MSVWTGENGGIEREDDSMECDRYIFMIMVNTMCMCLDIFLGLRSVDYCTNIVIRCYHLELWLIMVFKLTIFVSSSRIRSHLLKHRCRLRVL